ncbi:(2Fe-2S)-binding protein [Streptomyces sp. RerS4]|uniref:(2Fe-2S)-binding protein n=1 Tax=Streptomyces sp. RerS4 TaxID=2942449 RepID=UPI00201CA266|nr:(2Fe-2S)-binding protein [Streptomyces sp. RerS4]UQX03971.1 (2Fe-2S)-binding protein [Streptomyces sp. RerS4]
MTTPLDTPVAPTAVPGGGELADGYRRLVAVCEALDARVAGSGEPAPGEWVTGAELAESPEALAAFVAAESARIRERHGLTPRPDVAVSRALHDYLWSVSLLMSGTWYLDRRVPRIRPAEIRLNLTTGTYEVTPGSGFACLPNDPAADGTVPGVRASGVRASGVRASAVRTVGHEEALRAELRAAVADHVRPLLAAIGPHARRGPRALWGMVGDDLVSGIWYLGRVLDQEERAVSAATELLPTAIAPFPAGADFRRLAGREGRRYPTRTRTGCCLYYALDAARPCGTCPRTSDAERVRRLEDEA